MKITLIFLFAFTFFKAFAQPYTVENGNTRHRFAQLELGLTQYYSANAGKTQVLSDNTVKDYQFGPKQLRLFLLVQPIFGVIAIWL